MKTPQVVIASVLMALLMMNTAAAAQEYPYKVLVEDFEGGIFEQLDDTKWNRDSWWNGEGTANHQGTIFRELIVEDGALQFNADQTALSSAQTLEVFPGLRVLPMVRGDLKFQANVGVAVTGEAGKYWNGVVRMRLDLAGISDNRVEVGIKKGQSEGCDGCSYYKAYLKKKVSGEWVDIGGNYSDGKEFKLDPSAVDVLGDETLLSLTTQDGVLTARLGDTEIGHVSIWDGKY
ncbi:MAG: hypothetical protein HOF48_10440, partial [Gammaproteobacteria bacterium]|nr:hypothetical protein [Gammaproteobacteria bacterium]